jgi:hypothetical protein
MGREEIEAGLARIEAMLEQSRERLRMAEARNGRRGAVHAGTLQGYRLAVTSLEQMARHHRAQLVALLREEELFQTSRLLVSESRDLLQVVSERHPELAPYEPPASSEAGPG